MFVFSGKLRCIVLLIVCLLFVSFAESGKPQSRQRAGEHASGTVSNKSAASGDAVADDDNSNDYSVDVKHIARMVNRLTQDNHSTANIDSTIKHMTEQLAQLTADVNSLSNEVRRITGTSQGDAIASLFQDVGSLHTLISVNSQQATSSLENLKKTVSDLGDHNTMKRRSSDVNSIGNQAIELEEEVRRSSSTLNILSFIFITMMIVIGGLLYRKQRQLEKRHIL